MRQKSLCVYSRTRHPIAYAPNVNAITLNIDTKIKICCSCTFSPLKLLAMCTKALKLAGHTFHKLLIVKSYE